MDMNMKRIVIVGSLLALPVQAQVLPSPLVQTLPFGTANTHAASTGFVDAALASEALAARAAEQAAQATANAALPASSSRVPAGVAGAANGSAVLDSKGNLTSNSTIASGTTGARSLADRSGDFTNVKDGRNGQAGAKGDGQIANPTLTLSGANLSVTSGIFKISDIGKTIVVAGAGVAPTSGPIETIAVTSAGSGYNSLPTVVITDGASTGAGATAKIYMGLQSATLVSGGAGCLSGAFEMVLGTDGIQAATTASGNPDGTPAKITGTVSSGAVTGSVVVTAAGLLPALGNLSAAPAYGANCTTAPTFALSYGVAAVQMTRLGSAYSVAHTSAAITGGTPTSAAVIGHPLIGAPVAPLITTISSYTSATSVTLAAPATTTISNAATQILWATNDGQAIQNALDTNNGGIWIPGGIYWIGNILRPPNNSTTIKGEGLNNTVLAFDNGTGAQDSQTWTPLFRNLENAQASFKGDLQFEDFQIRGLLDFGRVNVGAAAIYLNNYNALNFSRMKFYQIPWMANQNERNNTYTVTNSVFDTVMRDAARCRSCFSIKITGNKFIHSDDDSVALHQASYIQGPGNIRESIIVSDNEFEDTTGVHILGARMAVVRGNTFRRTKLQAITMSWDSGEGINQLRGIIVADNIADDFVSRAGDSAANCVYCFSANPPSSIAGVTSFLPGANAFPSAFFGKPWDYDNAATTTSSFSSTARGVDIHDNITMRTLPAVSNYSSWNFGNMLSDSGFIDPVISDAGMRPTIGIAASANITGLSIHHNNIQNVRRGIQISDNVASPSQAYLSITHNHIFDAWEYGFFGVGSGGYAGFDLIGNQIDVDPYGISPGRSGLGDGGWSNGYATSRCVYTNYNASVDFSNNTMSNCYSTATSPTWVTSNNIIRGSIAFNSSGQQNVWSQYNQGFGVFPTNTGSQFFVSPTTSDPANNAPGSFGALSASHIISSAAAPTSGYHVTGDAITSSNPAACSCSGWLVLTTSSTWLAGTDFKVMPIQ